jgi:YYY domain-containing protein
MLYLFTWWILLLLLGLAALPVAFRFFKQLPDRGYAFAKPLAILLVVYPFWLLTSFGLVQNTFGAIALMVLLVAALAWGWNLWRQDAESPGAWLRANWRHALAVELVFSIAFFAFAYYRAFNPEISATEKPMEFMFLNSILKSAQFPPHDAWLSGFGISYYYLGYVIVAALTNLTAVPSSYAFNLGLIMVYALTATGAFGLVYNLVARANGSGVNERVARNMQYAVRTTHYELGATAPYFFGVLAVLLLLVVGNLEAPFESLHSAGIGSAALYQWLDVNDLAGAPQSGSLVPPSGSWWWWRASRVVNDHNPVTGAHSEVIDEFPSFSFLLGDLHPHVLALPFDLLALASALNLLSARRRTSDALLKMLGQWLTPDRLLSALVVAVFWLVLQVVFSVLRGAAAGGLAAAIAQAVTLGNLLGALVVAVVWLVIVIALGLRRAPEEEKSAVSEAVQNWLTPGWLLTAILLGALGMLNTWDIVTYGFVIVAAFAIAEFRAQGRWSSTLFVKSALFGLALLAVSYLLYLPFYIGFSSQVQGIAPVVFDKTPLHQYLMMFGLFVFVLASFVGVLLWQRRAVLRPVLRDAGTVVVLILAVPIVVAAVGLVVLSISAGLRDQIAGLLQLSNSNQVTADVLRAYVGKLLTTPGVFLLLTALLAGIVALAHQRLETEAHADGADVALDTSVIFALLLAFTGFLLTFGVEFLYVRDIFGTRMNTVFKLYFQAWTLFAIAAAFGAYYIWRNTRGSGRGIWTLSFGILFLLSLVYPVLAYPARANNFQANAEAGLPTLDGTFWIKNSTPDVYAAIQWMEAHAPDSAVILEAPGREYTSDDPISTATGLPTVLGWGGHELQWRGNYDEPGKREKDIQTIYTTTDVNQALALLQKYGVDYVVVGSIEREKYALSRPMIAKFGKLGQQVFAQGNMQIFQVH